VYWRGCQKRRKDDGDHSPHAAPPRNHMVALDISEIQALSRGSRHDVGRWPRGVDGLSGRERRSLGREPSE
jgi:hypothetical protein